MADKLFKRNTSIGWYIYGLMPCWLALLMIMGFTVSPVSAQEASEPTLRIENINVDDLPLVKVLVSGENLPVAIDELELGVREDGIDHPVIFRQNENIGLQIGLIVDPAVDLSMIGNNGDLFRFDIAYGASSLIESGILTAQTDWLAAFAVPEDETTFQRITDWQRDHQGVVNTLYQLESTNFSTDVTLEDSLLGAITNLTNAEIAGEQKRILIVFSDGTNELDNSSTNTIINDAKASNISINLVMLGDGSTDAQRFLKRITEATDGQYAIYENKDSLTPIWNRLDTQTSLQEITYRMAKAQPNQVAIFGKLVGDETTVATEDFPSISLSPVRVTIEDPDANSVVTRTGDSSDSGLVELEPRLLPIQIALTWPDNVQREIYSVEYAIDDNVVTQLEPPFTSFEMPIEDLAEGNFTLSVSAIDEYGIASDITQHSFQVELVRPDAELVNDSVAVDEESNEANVVDNVAEVPQSVDNQQRGNEQGMNILGIQLPETIEIFGVTFLVNGITLLIALFPLIFLLALLLYWLTQRNDKVSEPDYGYYEYDNNGYFYRFEPAMDDMQLTQPQVSVLDAGDELTMPVQLPSFYTNADAYLVYVSGGDHLPEKIPIEANEPIRIGRKKSFCDQILDDQRVSRLHAVITCEGGSFYIKDEGSSGGTFVNRRKLAPTDKQLLKHSDIVNFNEVEYRFEVSTPKGSSATPEPSTVNRPEPLLPNIDFE